MFTLCTYTFLWFSALPGFQMDWPTEYLLSIYVFISWLDKCVNNALVCGEDTYWR